MQLPFFHDKGGMDKLIVYEYSRPSLIRTELIQTFANPNRGNLLVFIGGSLSEPHTSVTSLHTCVYVCLLGPTTYQDRAHALSGSS